MSLGNTDFKVASVDKLAYVENVPAVIIGFVSCGGCLYKKAITRAKLMVDRSAEAIVFASSINKGNQICCPCHHNANKRDAIIKKDGQEIKIIESTD